MNGSLAELQSFFDGVPTAGLIVLAILLQTVCRSVSQNVSAPVMIGCVFLLTGSFVYEYQRLQPYELVEFLQIATRCICVALIFMPFGNIAAWCWSSFSQSYLSWKFRVTEAHKTSREAAEAKRQERLEMQRQQAELANDPEPFDEDYLFEQAMESARLKFDRECQVINSFEDLDEFERSAAIDQARAKMTRRIHNIMQGEF